MKEERACSEGKDCRGLSQHHLLLEGSHMIPWPRALQEGQRHVVGDRK